MRGYINVHKFDVICLSETYLDLSILHNDNNLQVPGQNLYKKDHLINVKRGAASIYYSITVALKTKNIHYLLECINFEIRFKGKLCNFVTLYRSPNQSQDCLESLSITLN